MEAELVHLNRDGRIELWARRVGECKSSGLTVRKWCEQQHINEKTYFRWQKMIADKVVAQQSAGFVEVPPQPSASCGKMPMMPMREMLNYIFLMARFL